MDREEQVLWLLLQQLCGGSAAQLRKLQDMESSPARILQAKDSRWRRAGVSADTIALRAAWRCAGVMHPAQRRALCDQEFLQKTGVHLLAMGRAGYPPLLAEISDPPPLLYVRGNAGLLCTPQLAIVGSRKTSQVGRRAAGELAIALADCGLTITSGLALGIDAAAHRAVLDAGCPTIAVMATGIDRVYPARHRELAADILERGALVSEFPLGTSPRREHFPRRNRIISGLSLGVLVIEAALRSGSLITARLALEQNREVFSLPHSIFHPGGRGCNELLRQGACLVETAGDILQELGSLFEASRALAAGQTSALPRLSGAPAKIYQLLGYEPVSADELARNSDLDSAEILAALMDLQLRGLVEQSFGRFMKC
jgi:DNA processing protein